MLYAGTLVTLLAASGKAVAGGTASAGPVVGVATETITGDGSTATELERGIFQFANSASGDLIAKADVHAMSHIDRDPFPRGPLIDPGSAGSYRRTCRPPSTRRTSPVTKVASADRR